MFPDPLFSPSETVLILRWIDTADTFALPKKTVKKLRSLVALWR